MIHNDATPHIEVDPETYAVTRRRRAAGVRAGERLPMAQRYFLF